LKTAYTVSSTSKIGKDIRKQDAGREGSRKAGKNVMAEAMPWTIGAR
jgi:hypothetical protein